jgi:hypothetical protein
MGSGFRWRLSGNSRFRAKPGYIANDGVDVEVDAGYDFAAEGELEGRRVKDGSLWEETDLLARKHNCSLRAGEVGGQEARLEAFDRVAEV